MWILKLFCFIEINCTAQSRHTRFLTRTVWSTAIYYIKLVITESFANDLKWLHDELKSQQRSKVAEGQNISFWQVDMNNYKFVPKQEDSQSCAIYVTYSAYSLLTGTSISWKITRMKNFPDSCACTLYWSVHSPNFQWQKLLKLNRHHYKSNMDCGITGFLYSRTPTVGKNSISLLQK